MPPRAARRSHRVDKSGLQHCTPLACAVVELSAPAAAAPFANAYRVTDVGILKPWFYAAIDVVVTLQSDPMPMFFQIRR